MKHLHILTLAFIFSGNIFSQKISIKQRNETIGKGNNSALVATIFEANNSDIEKEWKSLMKDYDAKVTMGGEIFADNAKIKGFDNTCDIYARIKSINDQEKELIVAVDMGGSFINSSHPNQLKTIENLMYDFAVKITKEAIEVQIKEAEKTHKKMVKDQESLVDDKEQLLKDIENFKNKISQAEKDIVENEKMQETKKSEVEKQKKLLDDTKDKFKSVK